MMIKALFQLFYMFHQPFICLLLNPLKSDSLENIGFTLTDYGRTDGRGDIMRISLEWMQMIQSLDSRQLMPMLSGYAGCSGKLSKPSRLYDCTRATEHPENVTCVTIMWGGKTRLFLDKTAKYPPTFNECPLCYLIFHVIFLSYMSIVSSQKRE